MENDLGPISEAILSSYRIGGGMNNIDGSNLPSKRALASAQLTTFHQAFT